MKNSIYLLFCLILLGCEKINLPRLPVVSISQPEKAINFADKWKLEGRVEVDDDDSKLVDFDIRTRGFKFTQLKANTLFAPIEIMETILHENNTAEREDFEAETPSLELNQDYMVLAFIEIDENKRIYSDTAYFNTTSSIQLTSSFTEKDLEVTFIGSISGFEDGDNIDEYGHCWIRSAIRLENSPLIELANANGKSTNVNGKNQQYTEKLPFELGVYYYVRPYAIFNGQAFYGNTINEIFIGDFWEELAPYDECNTTYTPLRCIFEGVGFSIDKKGYIGMGKRNISSPNLSSIWEYDTEFEKWTLLEGDHEFPGVPRNEAITFTIGETAYVGGGRSNSGQLKDFYAYKENSGWERIDPLPIFLRSAVAFVIDEVAYVGTGRSCTATSSGCDFSNRFFKFTPSANRGQQWTQVRNYPIKLLGASAFSINSKGYVISGVNGSGYVTKAYEFDPNLTSTGLWTPITDFPGSLRQKSIGFSLNEKGYIGTGTNIGELGEISSLYDFFEFMPPNAENSGGSWKQVRNMGLNNRDSAMSFVIKDEGKGDKAYVYGGRYYDTFQTAANDFWAYTPDNE